MVCLSKYIIKQLKDWINEIKKSVCEVVKVAPYIFYLN